MKDKEEVVYCLRQPEHAGLSAHCTVLHRSDSATHLGIIDEHAAEMIQIMTTNRSKITPGLSIMRVWSVYAQSVNTVLDTFIEKDSMRSRHILDSLVSSF